MRRLIVATAMLVLPTSSHSQVVSIKENPPFQTAAPNLGWHEVISNRGTSSIEAMYVSFECPSSGKLTIYDSLFDYPNPKATPIAPSASIEVETGDPSKCSGGVKAAIFSDGHVEGGSDELRQVYDQRRGAYTALGNVMPLVNSITTSQDTMAHVVDLLSGQLEEGRRTHTSYSVGYCTIYVILKSILESDARGLHVPSDNTLHRAPKIDALMKEKGISRNVARATILSQKLGEWHSALEDHLGSQTQR